MSKPSGKKLVYPYALSLQIRNKFFETYKKKHLVCQKIYDIFIKLSIMV